MAWAEDGTSMFVILWEFEVKPGYEKSFQTVYGPEGAWVQLFRRDSHYHMTTSCWFHSGLLGLRKRL